MKVLFLSQYFPPESTSGSMRAYDLATALVKAGHEVTVIAEVPNHPHGVVAPEYGRKLIVRQMQGGLETVHVWVKTSPSKSFVNRILFYSSYSALASVASLLMDRKKYDVLVASSPPLFTGMAGMLVSKLRRIPMVLELQDLWPEAAVTVGELRNRWFIRVAETIEQACYRHASQITVTSQELLEQVRKKGVDADKLSLIRIGSKPNLYRPDPDARNALRAQLDVEDRFVVLFAGLHGLAYDLTLLIDAAKLLEGQQDIQFLCVGDGVRKDSAVSRAQQLGLTNVRFLPWQSRDVIADYFRAADVMAVPLKQPHIIGSFPVRVYDAMAAGLPVILSGSGEEVTVVETYGSGICVEPGNPSAMSDAICRLKGDPELRSSYSIAGRQAAVDELALDRLAERFLRVVETA